MNLSPAAKLQQALDVRQTLQFTIDSLQDGCKSSRSTHAQVLNESKGDTCPRAVNITQMVMNWEPGLERLENYLNDCTQRRIRRIGKGYSEEELCE